MLAPATGQPASSHPASDKPFAAELPGQERGALGLAAALLVFQAGLLAVVYASGAPIVLWFLVHVGGVAGFAAWVWRARDPAADLGPQMLALLACLVGGPAGALLAVASISRLAAEPARGGLLDAWYDRISLAGDIDPVTRLANTVDMGRAVQTSAAMPHVFAQVMSEGSLQERQAALGLIARRFHPSYAPALRAALVSSEPVIRVQAAAVAVKVRTDLEAAIDALLDSGQTVPDGAAAMDVAAQLTAIVSSGLLEDQDGARANELVAMLLAKAAAHLEGLPEDGTIAVTAQTRECIETELLRAGHYGAFRTLRRVGVTLGNPAPEGLHG